MLRFEDDAPAEAVSDALLNRSLFSPRRVVELDISRLLGHASRRARSLTQALEAWEKGGAGGRREAFRHARALLRRSTCRRGGDPVENAEAAREARPQEGRRAAARGDPEGAARGEGRRPGGAQGRAPACCSSAATTATVALLTAIDAAGGRGPAPGDRGARASSSRPRSATSRARRCDGWPRRSRRSARSTLEPDAIERLLVADRRGRRRVFAAELAKLLEWAGKGGRIRAADVEANVEDEASEDVYALLRRDRPAGRGGRARAAGAALRRARRARRAIGRSGRSRTSGRSSFFGMLDGEVRRMLLIRARASTRRAAAASTPSMRYADVPGPRAAAALEPVAPFGKLAVRRAGRSARTSWSTRRPSAPPGSARRSSPGRSRGRPTWTCALKTSAPPLETLSRRTSGSLIAGESSAPSPKREAARSSGRRPVFGKVSMSNLIYGANWRDVSRSICRPATALITGGSRGIGRAAADLLARGGRPRGDQLRHATRPRRTRPCARSARPAARRWRSRATSPSRPRPGSSCATSSRRGGGWTSSSTTPASGTRTRRAGRRRRLGPHLRRQPARGAFLVTDAAVPHLEKTRRRDRLRLLDGGPARRGAALGLRGVEGRADLLHEVARGGARPARASASTASRRAGWTRTCRAATLAQSRSSAREIERAIPIGRVASAADIAGPILFLVSDLARHVQGEVAQRQRRERAGGIDRPERRWRGSTAGTRASSPSACS